MSAPDLSVVIATYERPELLVRLLEQLGRQTLSPRRYEVVVVDDGSRRAAAPVLGARSWPYPLRALSQDNAGAAAARDRGIKEAKGRVIVIVDDDMQVEPAFLAAHLAVHDAQPHAVVLGRIRPDPSLPDMPLFERWHALQLDRFVGAAVAGAPVHGNALCTGNVSFLREDYEQVGGFDRSLERSEDAELGLRLEAMGARFVLSDEAFTIHGSDHTESGKWLGRNYRYGRFELRIGNKHAKVAHADPFRYLFALGWGKRALALQSLTLPTTSKAFAPAVLKAGEALDRLGLQKAALGMCGAVFGMEYFRGVREEAGSTPAVVGALLAYLDKAARSASATAPVHAAQAIRALNDLKADHAHRVWAEEKYGHHGEAGAPLSKDLVQKIGIQMMAAYRLMRFFHLSGHRVAARVTSRLMRHLYGCDIHWEAELSEGVNFVHGMGVAISHAAKVGPGCLISQNVTLGLGNDPLTKQPGAPTLEENVHIGAGATLLGPITIGANSKVMSNCVVTESVPPNSLVEAPLPTLRARVRPRAVPPPDTSPTSQRKRRVSG